MKNLLGKKVINLKHGSQIIVYKFEEVFEELDGKAIEQFDIELFDNNGDVHERIGLKTSFVDNKIKANITTSSYGSLSAEDALRLADQFKRDAEEFAEIEENYAGLTMRDLYEMDVEDVEADETAETNEETNDMTLQLTTSDEGIYQIVDVTTGDTAHSNMTDGGRESVLYFIDKLDVLDEIEILNGEGLPIIDGFQLVAERPNEINEALYEAIRIYSIMKHDIKVSLAVDEKAGQKLAHILMDEPMTAVEISHFIENIESEAVTGQFNGIEIIGRIDSSMLGNVLNIDIMEA